MPEVCPSTSACSMTDAGWPSNGFSCPQKEDSYVSLVSLSLWHHTNPILPFCLLLLLLYFLRFCWNSTHHILSSGCPGLLVPHRARYRDGVRRRGPDHGQGMAQVVSITTQRVQDDEIFQRCESGFFSSFLGSRVCVLAREIN
jgi:hypothetical protein